MHAIFLDSIFGMTMCVSLCGYMKWINLNNLINLEKVFRFAFQPMGAFDLFVTGRAQPFLLTM